MTLFTLSNALLASIAHAVSEIVIGLTYYFLVKHFFEYFNSHSVAILLFRLIRRHAFKFKNNKSSSYEVSNWSLIFRTFGLKISTDSMMSTTLLVEIT
ncbi:hypothetical protein BpHYR1_035416 [Brachionus plicatilis]|uniref:Uncharacterized protein n=1 Tax=Brachionus plicatilis TaxID=10195 RepID=A0A3M7R1W2_BRAPC|nr:hypothetical protein BpHYR1_035416 [Brachionus plicatilis]